MTLSERRARILALIVDDYAGSATPVGSQSVVDRAGPSVSAAAASG
jgi:transcriptional regulator of heat shock response